MEQAEILAAVCDLIAAGRIDDAKASLLRQYPRLGASTPRGRWSMTRLIRVFVRDGFTDRYFGDRLVFPGTLRALAILITDAFPYHPNWKQSETHPAVWELYPTIDHIVPVARGGADDESNVVTTSMLRNSAKGNWLVEELRWPVERAPILPGWDGLLAWFETAYSSHEVLRQDSAIQQWHRAANAA
jgi:hypothetical protein